MSTKNISTFASILTAILLILLVALSFLVELVVLNGYSDREGGPALLSFGVCQGLALILCVVLAGRLARVFAERYNWNQVLALIASVFSGAVFSGVLGGISVIVSIIVAEAIRK